VPEIPAVMLGALPITFESPSLLIAGVLLALGAAVVALSRRATTPPLFAILAGCGFVLIALAAGNPRGGDARPRVVVMVDESDSTRGAGFRDDGKLREDVEKLIGDQPYTIARFGGAVFPGAYARRRQSPSDH